MAGIFGSLSGLFGGGQGGLFGGGNGGRGAQSDAADAERMIVNGILAHQSAISFSFGGGEQGIRKILENLTMRYPELFSARDFRYTIAQNGAVTVTPNYVYNASEAAALMKTCEETADKWVANVRNFGSDYDKAVRLHDQLSRSITYTDDNTKERHSIVGVFTERKAVCEGIAKSYKFLLDRLGIPCLVAWGTAHEPRSLRSEAHSWNIVQLEGNWCHIDVTFDNTIMSDKIMRYDYFALTDDQIRKDHKSGSSDFPTANTPQLNYYTRQGFDAENMDKFKERVKNCITSGRTDTIIRLTDQSGELGLEGKIKTAIESVMTQTGVYGAYRMNFNVKQKVFHIHFDLEK